MKLNPLLRISSQPGVGSSEARRTPGKTKDQKLIFFAVWAFDFFGFNPNFIFASALSAFSAVKRFFALSFILISAFSALSAVIFFISLVLTPIYYLSQRSRRSPR
jgi:hypothetical protein